MRGIIILEIDENFEASLQVQYPENISDNVNLESVNLKTIIELHKKKHDIPNFFQIELNDLNLASFFTGSSLNHFVGQPNYIIIVLLDENEIKDVEFQANFEGMIRRIAYALIPQINSGKFEDSLRNFFKWMENNDLEPYWEEYIDGDMKSIEKQPNKTVRIPEEILSSEEPLDEEIEIEASEEKEELTDKSLVHEEMVSQIEEENEKDSSQEAQNSPEPLGDEKEEEEIIEAHKAPSEETFSSLEKEVLEEEIEDLKQQLSEKTGKIRELTRRITDYNAQIHDLEDNSEENKTLKESISKLTESNNKQINDLEEKSQKIKNLKDKLEEMIKDKETAISNLESEINNIKKESEGYIDSITSLKIKLRAQKNKDDRIQDNITDTIIDLKKEIKVLRRERDHYKKIVKENDLL